MIPCLFASDLHGKFARYEDLLRTVEEEEPAGLFIGGDILPSALIRQPVREGKEIEFIEGFLLPAFSAARRGMRRRYPRVFLLMGNDDPRSAEPELLEGERRGLWELAHGRKLAFGAFDVFGYACVPPTPFRLKDWERYDVSRYVDPGCVSPEEGVRTAPADADEVRYGTIQRDLERLTHGEDMERAIFLFHAPPYGTALDLADLRNRSIEGVPLDEHIGSMAVRRFVDERQPAVTLHGHAHESARLSGIWKIEMGRTVAVTAAHDGPELALVRFDADDPRAAVRTLL